VGIEVIGIHVLVVHHVSLRSNIMTRGGSSPSGARELCPENDDDGVRPSHREMI
jgi:hypothetical protein